MKNALSRRTLIKTIGYAGAAMPAVAPGLVRAASANGKVYVAGVGVGGKGWTDINGAAKHAEVVAFCDVETRQIKRRGGYGETAKKFPKATGYHDWRKLLEKEHKRLDGVTVSTPDHMHAPVSYSAIQLGLGTYTQKPMTRMISEARAVTKAAKRAGVATQMGNQHHSGIGYRMLYEYIRGGAIGKVTEAHAWSNRPVWPQGISKPRKSDPVPEGLHWDLWIGVARHRPFVGPTEDSKGGRGLYHPFNWRGWWDFGTGALGDMGCHIIDPVVWTLGLGPAKTIRYEGPTPNPQTYPEWEVLHYEFAGTKRTVGDTIRVKWYDGGKRPPKELAGLGEGRNLPKNGTLFIGEKGKVLTSHGGGPMLLPREEFQDYPRPQLERWDHYERWIDGIRGEGEPNSSFDYAGPLTETVLLGTVAARFPDQTLEWDSKRMRFPNQPNADEYIRPTYRDGWSVDGLV